MLLNELENKASQLGDTLAGGIHSRLSCGTPTFLKCVEQSQCLLLFPDFGNIIFTMEGGIVL